MEKIQFVKSKKTKMITVLGQIGKRDWETYEDTLSQIDRCIEKTDR